MDSQAADGTVLDAKSIQRVHERQLQRRPDVVALPRAPVRAPLMDSQAADGTVLDAISALGVHKLGTPGRDDGRA
jgi:hypothetical protein